MPRHPVCYDFPQGGHHMPQHLDVFISPMSDNPTVQEGE